jgi:hypothetical protein
MGLGVWLWRPKLPLSFLERGQADAFIAEIEQDEPETAVGLRVEPVELNAEECSDKRPRRRAKRGGSVLFCSA